MAEKQISQEKQREFLDKYEKLSKECGVAIVCSSYIKQDGEIAVRLCLSLRKDKDV